MSHFTIWMSHVTRINASIHLYEWVMSHISMSRVTRMNESCRTYDGGALHIRTNHAYMDQSCRTRE